MVNKQPHGINISPDWRLMVARICQAVYIWTVLWRYILLINSALYIYTWQQIAHFWNIWGGSMFVLRFFYFNRRGQFTCAECCVLSSCKTREKPTVRVFLLLHACGWCLLAPQINLLTVLYDTHRNTFHLHKTPSKGLCSIKHSYIYIQNLKMFFFFFWICLKVWKMIFFVSGVVDSQRSV